MDRLEQRFCEVRAVEGENERRIVGTVMRYGDTARIGGFSETVQPGAFEWEDVMLNVQHDRARPIARTGSGLVLENRDNALHLEATLPPTRVGDDALEAVRAGLLRGLSVEMRVQSDKWQDVPSTGLLRKINKATIRAVGLVDKPAYPQSGVMRAAADDVARAGRCAAKGDRRRWR